MIEALEGRAVANMMGRLATGPDHIGLPSYPAPGIKEVRKEVGGINRSRPQQGCDLRRESRPISRVLSRTAIHLGHASPHASSDLPGSRAGRTSGSSPSLPYLVLLRVGFTLPLLLPAARCALTAPFHPYPAATRRRAGRYIFCGTFRRLAPPRRYLAPCPVEPGLSSPRIAAEQRLPGRLNG